MYNYNNFYSGANKKIETLLHEVKTGLNEMKESKEVCQGPNKTIEALIPEIRNEMSELRKEMISLKENKTSETDTNKRIEALLHGVKNELTKIRQENKSLKENISNCKANATIIGLLLKVNLELSKLSAKIRTINKVYKSCAELYKAGHKVSGAYTINPDNASPFDVYCDQTTAGGGWTVIQKRLDGSVDFYRGWDDYKRGFGNLNGEFWLGLNKIHRLTKQRNRLRVDLEETNGKSAYAEYSFFGVGNEGSKYKLSLGTYSGTAGDSLNGHRDRPFSTKDRDNDNTSRNCATLYKGAWWYNSCHHSNLNGLYHKGKHSSYGDGVNWYHWKGDYYSAKRAEMKIKPVKA